MLPLVSSQTFGSSLRTLKQETGNDGTATVFVHVELHVTSGVRRPDPTTGRPQLPEPAISPAASVLVQALQAGDGRAPPVATATTDAAGIAVLTLPAGSYWIVIPPTLAADSIPIAGSLVRGLPDGTSVVSWASVDLFPGAATSITLALVQLRP